MPILDLNKMKVESKWHQFTSKVKKTATDAAMWMANNPQLTGIGITVATAAIGGAFKLGKGLVRTHNLRKETYNKERYIYDRSLGMYLHTKRPLRNKDYVMINQRRKNGEKLREILSSMNILD